MRYSPPIEYYLRKAGWFPGRSVELDSGFSKGYPIDHPAWIILGEFAYLQIDCELDSGEDFKGYLDIFDRDLNLERFGNNYAMLERECGTVIATVGLVNGLEEILVCSDGSVILVEMTFSYWAPNFDGFLERILTGRKRFDPPSNFYPGSWPFVHENRLEGRTRICSSETEAEQAGTWQPATRTESNSEDSDKPQPEEEGRSR